MQRNVYIGVTTSRTCKNVITINIKQVEDMEHFFYSDITVDNIFASQVSGSLTLTSKMGRQQSVRNKNITKTLQNAKWAVEYQSNRGKREISGQLIVIAFFLY